MVNNAQAGGSTHNQMNQVNVQSHLRVHLANFLRHEAIVTGANTRVMLKHIETDFEQLYLHMLLPYANLTPEEQLQRLLTLVGQALDTLEEWGVVVVDKVGKSRTGCDKASEVWRSADVAASLDKYLTWLFSSAPHGLKDYAMKKRRQYGHQGFAYDLEQDLASRNATDTQAPDWSSDVSDDEMPI